MDQAYVRRTALSITDVEQLSVPISGTLGMLLTRVDQIVFTV